MGIMKKVTVRAQILAAFIGTFVVMFASAWFIHSRVTTIEVHTAALQSDAIAGLYQSSLIKDALAADHHASVRSGGLMEEGQREPNRIEKIIAAYEQTIQTDTDREAFAKFKTAYANYENAKRAVSGRVGLDIEAKFATALDAIAEITSANERRAMAMADDIDSELQSLLITITAGSLFIYLVLAVSGGRLLTVIMPPLKELTALMDTMRQGDFTQRMKIKRSDELGELGQGFNRIRPRLRRGLIRNSPTCRPDRGGNL